VTERTFSWYSGQLENCQGEVEHVKTQLAEADADRLVKQAENERLQEQSDDQLRAEKELAEEIECLAAALDETHRYREQYHDEVDRLRAALSKGCERDPLHQCPNCRQALEEK
jgi:chromosome segregation ATPase